MGAPKRVLLLGATGTIGRATRRALIDCGHDVVCFGRKVIDGTFRAGDVTDLASIRRDGFRGERFDAVVSCLASRNGTPKDAWAIDYRAHQNLLNAAREAGVAQFVLLSAICVQKPLLAFQHAKLAFENELIGSGLRYSIVRPTAYFKSLSGQVARVSAGKPYLLFGDGTATACKPISDVDLGRYLADCLDDPARADRILPIGGPGDAITPREQGEYLFRRLDRRPRFKSVPVRVLDVIVATLGFAGHFMPFLADKAEFARIGRYYATESMLVWDAAARKYDAAATPSTGTETLFDYYDKLVAGTATAERGDHAVF